MEQALGYVGLDGRVSHWLKLSLSCYFYLYFFIANRFI